MNPIHREVLQWNRQRAQDREPSVRRGALSDAATHASKMLAVYGVHPRKRWETLGLVSGLHPVFWDEPHSPRECDGRAGWIPLLLSR